MSCPQHGPCAPFVTEAELCCVVSGGFPDPCLVEGLPISQDKIDSSIQAASELMWAATGRKFGKCTVTIRPCLEKCSPCPDGGELPFWSSSSGAFPGWGYDWGAYPWYPSFNNGVWTNVSCPCANECICDGICQIPLPYPVCCIDEVTIDDIIIPPEEYRVDDFAYLVLLEDSPLVTGTCFPSCRTKVTVTYGREVPQLVKMATAELACQFLKSCVGAPCQLPQRIQTMTRQGVTVGFIDQMAFLERGRTGIYLVDLAINTFNPYRLLKQASVYSIDNQPKWRRTDTAGDCE